MRLVSAVVFVLASLLLLGLFLVPIANYYQDESLQQSMATAMARANAQISRTLQAAYAAHTDSILYLSMQETPPRSSCASTYACLEESLTRLERETQEDQNIASTGSKAYLIWKQSKDTLAQWRTFVLTAKRETADRFTEDTLIRSNDLFAQVIADLERTQSHAVSSETQLKAATRTANETQMMRVFFLECSCLGLMTLSSWYVLRIRDLKDRNLRAEHLLSRATDAIDDRVRNMLQLIDSLIEMQKDESDPTRQQYVLENIASDIRAIATVHSLQITERLHDGIPMDVLVRRLAGRSAEYLPIFQFDSQPITLSVKKATSLALITNELLTFARRKGVFLHSVELHHKENRVRLNMNFSGSLDIEPENTSILMVNTLVRHNLAGDLQYHQETPQITICFPCDG